METLVRAVGALAFLLVPFALLVVVNFLRSKPLPPHGVRMPGLAIEFVTTPGEAEELLGERGAGSDRRAGMREGLNADYVFIAAYWLMFMGTSILLAQRDLTFSLGQWRLNPSVWLAAAAALCATGAAIFDLVENSALARLYDAEKITKPLLDATSGAGSWKWALSFAAIFLLSFTFLRADFDAVLVLGILYLLVAVLGWAGLLYSPRLIEAVFLLIAAGFVLLAVLFTFRTELVLRHL
ncbi:MAG TPA: hypothetical protein VFS10_20885 [Pyrinomonadaceae bacterium]|nr:hypothetical protein [Pyrinomonadaceae bacterium]